MSILDYLLTDQFTPNLNQAENERNKMNHVLLCGYSNLHSS